jgi:hypothetical protein
MGKAAIAKAAMAIWLRHPRVNGVGREDDVKSERQLMFVK